MGCSNGGRDGMVASQKFPDLFDGVVSQNPGFNLPQAAIAEAWNEQALAPLATHTDVNGQPYIPDTFPPQDLEVASAAILSACDALDGLVDGIIDNYHACTNDKVFPALDAYTCGKGVHGNTPHGGTCLTAAQVGALKKIYAGPKNSRGKRLYSNWFWDAGIWDPPTAGGAGFAAWNVAFFGPPNANTALNLTLGAGALPMIFVTPPVVTPVAGPTGQEAYMFKFNFDTDAPKIFAETEDYPQSSMDFMTGVSLDLRPFKNHGGKLIISSSVNDGIFSGASIARWYRKMNNHMDGKADRLCQAVHDSQYGPLRRWSGDQRLRRQRARCHYGLGGKGCGAGTNHRSQSQYQFPVSQHGTVRPTRCVELPDRRHAATLSIPTNHEIQGLGCDQ